MTAFPRPIVLVSRCLGFAACRYDGALLSNEFVERLKPFVEYQPVCPETGIGLGVPREAIRIVRRGKDLRLIQPATGRDFTNEMTRFAQLRTANASDIHGFILKSRSPSCAVTDAKIFAAPDAKNPIAKGPGFFAGAALSRCPGLPTEDEARLADPRRREHFLTRLFAKAAFEDAARTRSLKSLAQFHTANRSLLETHNRKEADALGRLVVNNRRQALDALIPDYRAGLALAFARPAKTSSSAAALLRALDSFTKTPTAREKARFMVALDGYRAGKMPLSAPRGILRAWIMRGNEKALARQSFFEPYPETLATRLSES